MTPVTDIILSCSSVCVQNSPLNSKNSPTMHQKWLFGDQKSKISPRQWGGDTILPTPHLSLGACGASTWLAP